MSVIHRIRSWSTAVAAAAVLFAAAAAPAVASTPSNDTGERLEAARVMLSSNISNLDAAQLAALSNTLSDALESAHFGFQTSALRLLIAYGDQVAFDRGTVFEVVKLYRNHKDTRVRRMAVVALGQMNDEWGIDFLERSLRFEHSAPVKHTISAVVAEHQADRS